MKEKILLFLLCALCSISGRADCEESFRRGLFVTVLQDPQVLSSREEIGKLVDFARSARIDELFVQVYYANRSWFPSRVADQTPYEACLKSVSEDAFRLLIKEAHAAGIKVHAWLNLLSLGKNEDAVLLKKYGTDILTRNRFRKLSLEGYKIDGQYFLEPGDERVGRALLDIVSEVVSAYKGLDGIQFDYIRYPDKDPAYGYTKVNMERFKKETGNKRIEECNEDWKDWKRRQVTELLEALGNRARSIRPDIQVSATGCMPYSRAYYEALQDWPLWLDRGFVDFVTVMSYSPFPEEFQLWIAKAKSKTSDFRKVNIGLGAYKLVNSAGIFEHELRICEGSGARGSVVFHYGSLLQDGTLGRILTDGR